MHNVNLTLVPVRICVGSMFGGRYVRYIYTVSSGLALIR